MPSVYLSYSHVDREKAEAIYRALKRHHVKVEFDESLFELGEPISKLAARIEKSSAVLLLLSKASKQSRWVNKELAHALASGKKVIPILLDGEATDNRIWPLVADRRAIQFMGRDGAHEIEQLAVDLAR